MNKTSSEDVLNITTIVILFGFSILWFVFSAAPILTLFQFFSGISSRFVTDFDSPAARSTVVFSSHPIYGFASALNWVLFYFVHALIAIGILSMFLKLGRIKIDSTYRIIMLVSVFLLILCVAIPNFAPAFNFTRFYALAMFFLAPCFVIGGTSIIDSILYVFRRKADNPFLRYLQSESRKNVLIKATKITSLILSLLLVCYFLSQSGFLNAVTNSDPLSIALNYEEMNTEYSSTTYKAFISSPNIAGAVWLSAYLENSTLYADYVSSFNILDNYGPYPIENVRLLNNDQTVTQNSVIFLGQINVVDGIVTTYDQSFNVSDISYMLTNSSLLYSNGNTEIFYASTNIK